MNIPRFCFYFKIKILCCTKVGVRIFFCKLSFCGKIYIFQGRAFVLPYLQYIIKIPACQGRPQGVH